MKTPSGPVRKPTRAKPKTRATPRASTSRKSGLATGNAASGLIDQRILDLEGWRGESLARMRALILKADPRITEEWKWNLPVWSHDGIICTGESYTKVVKLTFAHGAGLPDPTRLFNSSLGGNTRRAIDIHEGEKLDARAFTALVKAAAARNGAPAKTPLKVGKAVLLSGGNPRVAKADGDAPVKAYIAKMPGWKRDLGKRLDALIVRTVPNVLKAVKWNSPFYGMEDKGWFLSFHVFTRYLKVTFFKGTSLKPVPAGGTGKDARWIDVHEDDLDEAQMAKWVKQAARLPGWDGSRSS